LENGLELSKQNALRGAGFIPDGQDDNPSSWKCWLTDLVKCAETIEKWEKYKKNSRGKDILQNSMNLLTRELQIISPKVIVLMGDVVQHYYKQYNIRDNVEAIDINTRHYSRIIGMDELGRFNKRIEKIGKLLGTMKG
jgi:hypothetical protein